MSTTNGHVANEELLLTTLVKPVITEKATLAQEQANQYVFQVATSATKAQIRNAIEGLFKVDVLSVRVLNQQGKRKAFGKRTRGIGQRNATRKAYVRIADGQMIDYEAKV